MASKRQRDGLPRRAPLINKWYYDAYHQFLSLIFSSELYVSTGKSRLRDILGKPEIDDVISQGLSRGMSHQIAIVIRSYHGRVIFLDQSKASHFFSQKKFTKCETFQ